MPGNGPYPISGGGSSNGTNTGTFIGNGGGLTNVNAATLNGITSFGYAQTLSQGLVFWLNAKNYLSLNPNTTNGQAIFPTDSTGLNPIILTNSNPVLWGYGLNGLPSFYFPGNTYLIITNLFGKFPYLTNQFFLEVTFRDTTPTDTIQEFILGMNGPSGFNGRQVALRGWVDNGGTPTSSFGGGIVFWSVNNSPSILWAGALQAQWMTHVATLALDTNGNVWAHLDGRPVYDTRIQNLGSFAGLFNNLTNLVIGEDPAISGGNNFQGYISDIRVYSNAPSAILNYALDDYCSKDANLQANRLNMIGDSITFGLHANVSGGDLQGILNPQLPNLLFNSEAVSGRYSLTASNDVTQWSQYKAQGQNFAFIYVGINDFNAANLNGGNPPTGIQQSNQIQYTMASYTNIIDNLLSNGVTGVAICTLDSVFWETNVLGYNWRSNLNQQILGLTNLDPRVVVIPLAQNTVMGTNGAYVNTTYFNTDQVHPNSVGYTNMASFILPYLQQMIGGFAVIPLSSIKGVGGILNSYIYGAVTGTNTFSYFVPAGVTNSYAIYGKLTVTALSVDVAQPKLVWTDETGTVQTLSLGTSISGTGYNNLPYTTILAKGGTSIFVTNALTTATGSITYNVDAHLTGISSTQ